MPLISRPVRRLSPLSWFGTLYRGALDAVSEAQACSPRAMRRAIRAVSKAANILLNWPSHSIPRASRRWRVLPGSYDYAALSAAHLERSEAPLVEVASLLATLAEVWDRVDAAGG
jgi:flagellin-specific chaperone FliS